jgi:hypothetical protein
MVQTFFDGVSVFVELFRSLNHCIGWINIMPFFGATMSFPSMVLF